MANNTMEVCRTIQTAAEMRKLVRASQQQGRSVGVVPTMGALHAGHLSLVEQASRVCDETVVTIFVNRSQFGPREDFARYPRDLKSDLAQLQSLPVRFVFAPEEQEMYPAGSSTTVLPSRVGRRWEGTCRPGHFEGVATIVLKLFQVIPADHAFFGEKDFQQCRVIDSLVRDLLLPIQIHPCPTVRETDGLALSSRNVYLNSTERERALSLHRALTLARELAATGDSTPAELERRMQEVLLSSVDHLDYAAVVDEVTMEPASELRPGCRAVIAARVGSTRLIDNLSLIEAG